MLGRLILLVALIGGLLWLLRWFRRTPAHQVAKVLRRSLLWGGIGLVLLLVVSGRLNPLFAALVAVLPAVLRVVNLLRALPMIRQVLSALGLAGYASRAAGGGAQTSSIRTRFLEMTLNHASGEMQGLVLEGPFEGRRLSDLSLDQLMDLLGSCQRSDAQSAAVLEAYLDRNCGEQWRDRDPGEGTGPAPASAMANDEALAILGLSPGATEQQIRDAHRRLMQRFHPDRGGSDYLAAKINQAKRLLLNE